MPDKSNALTLNAVTGLTEREVPLREHPGRRSLPLETRTLGAESPLAQCGQGTLNLSSAFMGRARGQKCPPPQMANTYATSQKRDYFFTGYMHQVHTKCFPHGWRGRAHKASNLFQMRSLRVAGLCFKQTTQPLMLFLPNFIVFRSLIQTSLQVKTHNSNLLGCTDTLHLCVTSDFSSLKSFRHQGNQQLQATQWEILQSSGWWERETTCRKPGDLLHYKFGT